MEWRCRRWKGYCADDELEARNSQMAVFIQSWLSVRLLRFPLTDARRQRFNHRHISPAEVEQKNKKNTIL